MMKSVLSLMLVGCATTGAIGTDREAAPQTGVRVDLAASFPRVEEPRLPSADSMSNRVRDRLGTEASVRVDLCVGADGHVSSVTLLRGTTMEMFDQAVLRDASAWKFAAIGTSSCAPTTIVYRPAA